MVEDTVANSLPRSCRKVSAVAIDGQRVNVSTMGEAVECSLKRLRDGRGFTFLTLNLDHMVKRRADAGFREAYQRADFISADGQPVVALARQAGIDLDRVTGADLVTPLCAAAAKADVPVYLFGTTEPALQAASEALRRACPGLVIAGSAAPPMDFDPSGSMAHEAAATIARSGAKLCFVALPALKHVAFMDRSHASHPAIGFVGVGAAIDFLAGTETRAPRVFQRAGIEWLWRFNHQPRLLFRRYLDCGLLYLKLRASGAAAVRL